MTKHGISRLALLAALAAAPGLAQAQDSAADEDGEVVVLDTVSLTASTVPVALSRTGVSVSVLDRSDIEAAGTLSFGTLAAMQPGVSFDATGGLGTTSNLRIRGLPGYYVGARLDGFDVSDTAGTQFAFNFGSLTTAGIDRVEILRGAQSALYGSEAIAGVVDITTFRPTHQGVSGRAALEAGSDSTYSGSVAAGYLDDRLELAFSASRTTTDGGFSGRTGGVEDDGHSSSMLTAYGAWRVTEDLRVGANLLWRTARTDYDDSATAETGSYSDLTQRGGRVFAEFDTGSVSHAFSVSRLTNDRAQVSGSYGPGYYDGSRNEISYKGNWKSSEALSLNWGFDDTRETMTTGYEAGKVTTRSVYGEVLYAPVETLDLSFALRHDDHEKFGGKVTGRAAAAWHVAPEWTLRAVAATGFRSPSLYELYSDLGDENMKPEKSRSFELGVQRDFGDIGFIQATVFDSRIEDRIDYDANATACGSPWGCYSQIDGHTDATGVEIEGRARISADWSVYGNYTYTDSTDTRSTGTTRSSRVPRHSLNLGVQGQITDQLSGGLAVRYVADNYDSYGTLSDFTLVDVSIGYTISDAAEAYLRVENLFDKDYHTAYGYDQPGRQVFVGVRTSF